MTMSLGEDGSAGSHLQIPGQLCTWDIDRDMDEQQGGKTIFQLLSGEVKLFFRNLTGAVIDG